MSILEEQADVFLGDEDAMEIAQAVRGQSEEFEHTSDPEEALHIALTHLNEDPDYYTKVIPAINRDGYQIDLMCVNDRMQSIYYASLVSEDRGHTWFVKNIYVVERSSNASMLAMDVLGDALRASATRTFYESFVGMCDQRLADVPYFVTLLEQVGNYEGLHGNLRIPSNPKDFLQAIHQLTTSITAHTALF